MSNTIPEQLRKLKAALEDGKREDVLNTNVTVKGALNAKSQHENKHNASVGMDTDVSSANITHGALNDKSFTPAHKEAVLHVKIHNEKKPIPLGKNVRVKEAGAWLIATFPNLFRQHDPLPLKIGIVNDIKRWIEVHSIACDQYSEINARALNAPDGAGDYEVTESNVIPTKRAIRDAITVYVNKLSYQKVLCVGDKRYDLTGNPVDVVDALQKEHAKQRCAEIMAVRQMHAEKRQAYRERLKDDKKKQ